MSDEIDWPASASALEFFERTSGRSVIAWFTLALALLTGVAFLIHSSSRSALDAQARFQHARDTASALDNVSATVGHMDQMQARYLLTDDAQDSHARNVDIETLGQQLHRLRALIANDSAQSARLAATEPMIARLLSRFRAAGPTPPAARSIESDNLIDDLSTHLLEMRKDQNQRVAQLSADLQHRVDSLPFTFIVLLLFASASLCFAYSIYHRYVKQRIQAEKAGAARNQHTVLGARARCDIRSCLTAILGYCDLPMDSATPLQDRLDLIRGQTNQIIAAVNDLLNTPENPDASPAAPDSSRMDPLCPRKTGAEALANTASALRFTGRVLLAEDNANLQQVIKFYLQAAGADVTIAADGKLACERAMNAWSEQKPFDLILMDIQMPSADGRSATIMLRDAGYTGPIVALTANATEQERGRCLAAGCNGFLAKPVDQEQFLRTMRRYLQPETPTSAPTADSAAEADAQFAALRANFESELPTRIADIRTAVLAGHYARVADLAHQLKGTSGCFGLTPIYETAGALQQAAEHPEQPSGIEKALQALTQKLPKPTPAMAA